MDMLWQPKENTLECQFVWEEMEVRLVCPKEGEAAAVLLGWRRAER